MDWRNFVIFDGYNYRAKFFWFSGSRGENVYQGFYFFAWRSKPFNSFNFSFKRFSFFKNKDLQGLFLNFFSDFNFSFRNLWYFSKFWFRWRTTWLYNKLAIVEDFWAFGGSNYIWSGNSCRWFNFLAALVFFSSFKRRKRGGESEFNYQNN